MGLQCTRLRSRDLVSISVSLAFLPLPEGSFFTFTLTGSTEEISEGAMGEEGSSQSTNRNQDQVLNINKSNIEIIINYLIFFVEYIYYI